MLIGEDQPDYRIGYCHDLYPGRRELTVVELPRTYAAELTGIAIEPEKAAELLQQFGFCLHDNGPTWQVTVPSFRVDVSCKQDLVEEIIRLRGYDALPALIPFCQKTELEIPVERNRLQAVKSFLVGSGFNEVINYTFASPEDQALFSAPARATKESGRARAVLFLSSICWILERGRRSTRP